MVETADGTVYYVDNLQQNVMQKIEIIDAEVIATNGMRESGSNYFIDNKGKVYTWGNNYYGQLGDGTNEDINVPICITDNKSIKLYNKKIKFIRKSRIDLQNYISYITQEGELYNYYFMIIES